MAFGLGTLLLNRQHVITTMETRFKDTAEEMRAGFRRDLELQMMRMQARHSTEIGEVRQELVMARTESQMNAAAALTWQRRVEDVEKQLLAGIHVTGGGDVNIGAGITGGNHTETASA